MPCSSLWTTLIDENKGWMRLCTPPVLAPQWWWWDCHLAVEYHFPGPVEGVVTPLGMWKRDCWDCMASYYSALINYCYCYQYCYFVIVIGIGIGILWFYFFLLFLFLCICVSMFMSFFQCRYIEKRKICRKLALTTLDLNSMYNEWRLHI